MTPVSKLNAFHEAGHAAAYCLHGSLRWVGLVDDEDVAGLTCGATSVLHRGFASYAGPWAAARLMWGTSDLRGQDADGYEFPDHVVGMLHEEATGDLTELQAHWDRYPMPAEERLREQADWDRDLNHLWPAIEAIAYGILAGEDPDAIVDLAGRQVAAWADVHGIVR